MLQSTATHDVEPSPLVWWVVPLLIAMTLLAYSNSFTGEFIFDDEPHIQNDPTIRALTPPRYTWLNTRRPFVKLTLAIQYQLHGQHVVGYHVFNLLIHIAAGLVLMGLIRRTLALPQFADRHARAGPWIAATVALIWLLHPIQTQAVTYVIQRAESMMSLLMLLSLYCLLRGATSSNHRAKWYVVSVLSCFVAMGTKEVGVVTPVIALLFDRTFLTGTFTRTVKLRWWYLVLMFMPFAGVAWLGLGDITAVGGAAGFGMDHITWQSYLLTQPLVIIKYLLLIAWPAHLSIDHLHPTIDMLSVTKVLGLYTWQWAFALVSLIFIGTVIALYRKPWLGFLGLAFFVILAPSSSILPVADVMVEHRVYLVLAIIILLVVLAVDALLRRCAELFSLAPRRVVTIAAVTTALVSIALGTRTWIRNTDYRSSLSIWRATAQVSPLNARAWNNLGRSIYDDDPANIAQAIDAYRRALRLLPDDPEVTAALGTLLAETGSLDEAEHLFKQTLSLDPDDHVIRQRLGVMYMRQNRLPEALQQFELAAATAPNDGRVQLSLGVLLVRMGDHARSIVPLRAAVQVNPKLAEAWLQLAAVHVRRDEHDAAITALREATAANSEDARLWIALGQLLVDADQRLDAIDAYRRAIAAEPQALSAYIGLGAALEATGDDRAALQVYRDAGIALPDATEPALRAAWLLATSHDDSLRNGDMALRFATAVAQKLGGLRHPEQLDILAAAQARTNHYDEAVATAQQAIGTAEVIGKVELAEAIRQRLTTYQRGEPFTQDAP